MFYRYAFVICGYNKLNIQFSYCQKKYIHYDIYLEARISGVAVKVKSYLHNNQTHSLVCFLND